VRAFPAPGAPLLIPEECSAENNSVTVAWQPPPGHGIMGCAGQRGPAIEGYLLELDDGCGGEFRVSKHCTLRKILLLSLSLSLSLSLFLYLSIYLSIYLSCSMADERKTPGSDLDVSSRTPLFDDTLLIIVLVSSSMSGISSPDSLNPLPCHIPRRCSFCSAMGHLDAFAMFGITESFPDPVRVDVENSVLNNDVSPRENCERVDSPKREEERERERERDLYVATLSVKAFRRIRKLSDSLD